MQLKIYLQKGKFMNKIEQLNNDVDELLGNIYAIMDISKVIEQIELYCTNEFLPTEHVMPVIELLKDKLENLLKLLEQHQQHIWKMKYGEI